MRWRPIHLLLALLAWPVLAWAAAVDPDPLPDPAKEAQARAIMREIKCVVCAGEAIAESNAQIAQDMRRLVREQVAEGKDAAGVKAYFVERYGESVLLRPPVKPVTWPLWAAPVLLVLVGALVARRLFVPPRREDAQ